MKSNQCDDEQDEYTKLRQLMESAQYYTLLDPRGMVSCATIQFPSGSLGGKIFNIFIKNGRWWISTWLGAMYLTSADTTVQSVSEIAIACLQNAEENYGIMLNDIVVAKYDLQIFLEYEDYLKFIGEEDEDFGEWTDDNSMR